MLRPMLSGTIRAHGSCMDKGSLVELKLHCGSDCTGAEIHSFYHLDLDARAISAPSLHGRYPTHLHRFTCSASIARCRIVFVTSKVPRILPLKRHRSYPNPALLPLPRRFRMKRGRYQTCYFPPEFGFFFSFLSKWSFGAVIVRLW